MISIEAHRAAIGRFCRKFKHTSLTSVSNTKLWNEIIILMFLIVMISALYALLVTSMYIYYDFIVSFLMVVLLYAHSYWTLKTRGPLTLRAALCPPVAARAVISTAETTERLVLVDVVLSIVPNPKWPRVTPFPCPTAPLLLPASPCPLIVLGRHALPRQTPQRAGLTRNPHEVRLHMFYLFNLFCFIFLCKTDLFCF